MKKLIKKVEECEQFHSFGGKSKVSDLVRHRRTGSNTSLPEMINNNNNVNMRSQINQQQVQYDSSSADDELNIKSRDSSGESMPYNLKRELERRRIKTSRKKSYRMSAESEESFDDTSDLRLRSVTSGSSGTSQHYYRRRSQQNPRGLKRPEETHF